MNSVLLCASMLAQGQWSRQESGTTADLRGVWFVDSQRGWACGDSGVMLNTVNGGETWQIQTSGIQFQLEDVFFLDSMNGWACGDSGAIVRTTNGGRSWESTPTPVRSLLHGIQFRTPRYGIASGDRNTILSSNDSGRTWSASSGSDSGTASIVSFWIDERRGSFVSNDISTRTQFFTLDAGITWRQFVFLPRRINDICGLRAVYNPNFMRTYYFDVGENGFVLWWYYCEDSLGQNCNAVGQIGRTDNTLPLFAVTIERRDPSPTRLWTVGGRGWIASSTDTGKTWQTVISGTIKNLNGVSFPLENRGWAVGDSGIIIHYATTVGVAENSAISPKDFFLGSPFPNPLNPTATVELLLPQEEHVTIGVYDILGKRRKLILNSMKDAGKHRIGIDLVDFASGVYFLRATTQKNSKIVKLVLMK